LSLPLFCLSTQVRMCAGHVQDEVTPATAPDIIALADRHNMPHLKKVVMDRLLRDKDQLPGDQGEGEGQAVPAHRNGHHL